MSVAAESTLDFAARTTMVEQLYHASEDAQLPAEASSRWGHGGIYCTLKEQRQTHDGRAHQLILPGPFRLFGVKDETTGSGHLWQGYGTDRPFQQLLLGIAAEVGLPAEPGMRFSPGRNSIVMDGEVPRRDEDGKIVTVPNPDYTSAWIDYGRALQRRLREKLEAQGFDGIWIGGEVVVWNLTPAATP
jgi:hypothetical protein